MHIDNQDTWVCKECGKEIRISEMYDGTEDTDYPYCIKCGQDKAEYEENKAIDAAVDAKLDEMAD